MSNLLTPGKYRVKAIDAFMTESQKGTVGLCWSFMCESGRIECTRWVTENTTEYVKKDMVTLGFPEDKLDDIGELENLKKYTCGNEVEIVVEDEEYQGSVTAKVKWINKIGSRPSGGPGVRDRLHALLSGRPAPLVSQPRQQSQMEPFAPVADDDVPY